MSTLLNLNQTILLYVAIFFLTKQMYLPSIQLQAQQMIVQH